MSKSPAEKRFRRASDHGWPRTLAALRDLLADGEPHPLPDPRAVRLASRLALRGECRVYGPLPDRRAWAVRTDSPWRWSCEARCWWRRV
ncbi:MAG TPA: hypothetical protein VF192_01535 [Longimicrobiales bacterium]